jgi:hypothetical protein
MDISKRSTRSWYRPIIKSININVRNFNFLIGFYSKSHPPLNPSKYDLFISPFTTKLKTLGPTRNIYFSKRSTRSWYRPIIKSPKQRLEAYCFRSVSSSYYYYYSPFFLCDMNVFTADLRKYWTEFHETWWSYRYMFLDGTCLQSVNFFFIRQYVLSHVCQKILSTHFIP